MSPILAGAALAASLFALLQARMASAKADVYAARLMEVQNDYNRRVLLLESQVSHLEEISAGAHSRAP